MKETTNVASSNNYCQISKYKAIPASLTATFSPCAYFVVPFAIVISKTFLLYIFKKIAGHRYVETKCIITDIKL